jgi:hypothetical protein
MAARRSIRLHPALFSNSRSPRRDWIRGDGIREKFEKALSVEAI